MGALQADTAVRRDGERLSAQLSRDWEIWGPNGGYLSVIALRAAGAVAPADHRPASLSVQYIGVADFSEVEAEVVPVKQGRSAWLMNVRLLQGGKAFLQAQVWTTNRVDGPITEEAAPPDVPHPDTLKSIAEHLGPEGPKIDGFWKNIDFKPLRFRPWDAPREAAPAILREWYRFWDFEGEDVWVDFGRAVVLIDTLLWPTHHRGLPKAPDYIAPSLDVNIWFHEPPGEAEWLLMDARADIARSGLIHGFGRVWTPEGRCVASGGSNLLYAPRR